MFFGLGQRIIQLITRGGNSNAAALDRSGPSILDSLSVPSISADAAQQEKLKVLELSARSFLNGAFVTINLTANEAFGYVDSSSPGKPWMLHALLQLQNPSRPDHAKAVKYAVTNLSETSRLTRFIRTSTEEGGILLIHVSSNREHAADDFFVLRDHLKNEQGINLTRANLFKIYRLPAQSAGTFALSFRGREADPSLGLKVAHKPALLINLSPDEIRYYRHFTGQSASDDPAVSPPIDPAKFGSEEFSKLLTQKIHEFISDPEILKRLGRLSEQKGIIILALPANSDQRQIASKIFHDAIKQTGIPMHGLPFVSFYAGHNL